MEKDEYLCYVKETILGYRENIKKYIFDLFIKNGIAKKENFIGQLSLESLGITSIPQDMELDEQITYCIEQNECALKLFETWEFKKHYKYSVLFTCNDFSNFLEKVKAIPPLEKECEKDYVFDTFKIPVVYFEKDYTFLKFNLKFSAIDPQIKKQIFLKYPFLIVLHHHSKIVEIRFDSLNRYFRKKNKEQTVYSDLITAITDFLNKTYNCFLDIFDLEFMIEVAKKNIDVKLTAQSMELLNGGKAKLEVGLNEEYILPFIGELKAILVNHSLELNTVPLLKEDLENFMFENEEMSNYPWIELLWEKPIKAKNIRIKLNFNYMNKSYCLIQHYYNNVLIGMERMNYVIEYIVSHRKNNKRKIK